LWLITSAGDLSIVGWTVSELPEQLPALMRAYIDGKLELETFVARVFPLWRDEGWGPYFDVAQLDPEQRQRAQAFEERFTELTQAEVRRLGDSDKNHGAM
jgi:hypothetical protein